jgi:hypothetical protein
MTIDHSLENLDDNFLGILESIKKMANYWKRYRLSLPGRINVAKSLLVSLVNYLGCFLMPKPNTLNNIQKTIDYFIIAIDKVFFSSFFRGIFYSFSYNIQHCFICRPSDSTVPTDAGIEPRTVATCALAVRRSNHYARSHPHYARSHPHYARSHLDKVARNRLYLPPECGGLGCFKLDDFLFSQQCVWPLRAAISSRDNWRVNLKE